MTLLKKNKLIKIFNLNTKSNNKLSQPITIYTCDLVTSHIPLIFFTRKTENIETAIDRYTKGNQLSKDWTIFFDNHLDSITKYNIKKSSELNKKNKNILLIANKNDDHEKTSTRIKNFKEKFKNTGYDCFLLPINFGIGLTEIERENSFKEILSNFSIIIFMGGADIDPQMYGQVNHHSNNTFLNRDIYESTVFKKINQLNKGRSQIIGICRGAQLIAVNLGYELIQDLTIKKLKKSDHTNSETQTIYRISNSKIFSTNHIQVNSYHHQAIKTFNGGPLKPTFISDDGVPEVLENKKTNLLLLQFHPEMNLTSIQTKVLTERIINMTKKKPG